MARSFSSKDASKLIRRHQDLLTKERQLNTEKESLRQNIVTASETMVARARIEVLRKVSVDELNRDKNGIRIKALKEYGYNNMADLASASVHQLASVHGISEDTAYRIKKQVSIYAEQAGKGLKIKLSSDNKNKDSTRLVIALSIYRRISLLIEQCDNLRKRYEQNIEDSIEDLTIGTSGFKWFFSSASKKEQAEIAYKNLSHFLNNEYAPVLNSYLDQIEKIRNTKSTEAWTDFEGNSIQFFNLLEDINPGVLGTDDSLYGLPEDLARKIQDEAFFPDGLLCTLRRYQEWGVKYILHQQKVLLGDEMGLGKTIQAIAVMVSLRNTGATHFIVVCPASVISNWCREIQKQSLLKVTKIHGVGRNAALNSWIRTGGVAVTTYETTSYIDLEENFKYSMLVVDEAHYIKNASARRTVNVIKLSTFAERMLFMTGTALENNVDEMISLIKILRPDIARTLKNLTFMIAAPQFREKIAPVYYRRKRKDVLTELPELIESKEWCNLSDEEEKVYENNLYERNYQAVRRVSWNVGNLENSCKARRLQEIVEEAESDGRKVIVFSFFLDTIRELSIFLNNRCMEPINGSVNPQRRQDIIDEFDKAPAGTVLLAQIQSGGTGLNIQSASVVIICEPQFKPSIENQAISRAYRMGQARNVLVYRLLCENTVDEQITQRLEEKQQIFDAYADKSVAAQNAELDEKSFKNIIQDEIDRINREKGNKNSSDGVLHQDPFRSTTSDREGYGDYAVSDRSFHKKGESKSFSSPRETSKNRISNDYKVGYNKGSVTFVASQVVQPTGGYINPKSMRITQLPGGGIEKLYEYENVSPILIGIVVDYLTRFMNGASIEKAFRISMLGAEIINKQDIAKQLLYGIVGLDDRSIKKAVKLSGFDVCYRTGIGAYKPIEGIEPNADTIENIRTMVERSLRFIKLYGPITIDGFDLRGGYSSVITSGDGDYLTKDTLWDFKVSKNDIKPKQTLQILLYWRMGLRSVHKEFKDIQHLGIYNPRKNIVYKIDTSDISDSVCTEIDHNIIGYGV